MTTPTPAGEPNVIVRNAKALLATLAAIGTALAVVIADPSTSALLPENWVQWIATGAGALVALGAVFGIRNSRTVEQAQEDLDRAVARKAKRTAKPRRPALRHPSSAEAEVLAEDVDDDPGRHRADGTGGA